MKKNCYNLKIADFNFSVKSSESKLNLILDEGYTEFFTSNEIIKNTHIEAFSYTPEFINGESIKIFDASFNNNEQKNCLWSIHKFSDQYVIFSSDFYGKKYPYLIACFTPDYKNWKIYPYKPKEKIHTINPMAYPMGALIFYYVISNAGAAMIHASGITRNNKGYLFTGFSGAGKSTMANLWLRKGAKVINDDRLIIRKKKDKHIMYNTPMYYKDTSKNTTLDKIFIIRHGYRNRAVRLTGAKAVSKLMAFCIQHDYNSSLINKLLIAITDIAQAIPIYELEFVPDNSVINYIENL